MIASVKESQVRPAPAWHADFLAMLPSVSGHQHHNAMGAGRGARCYRVWRAARRRRAALSCLRSALSRRSSTR